MARKGGVDRGITQRKGRKGWWVRVYVNGREKWHRCDTKSQAKALHGRLRAEIREGIYFPEKFAPKKEITLRAWITRCLESSTNRGLINERRYGRRWTGYLGRRVLTQITVEDLKRIQAKMCAKMKKVNKQEERQWTDATINRHFGYLRRVFNLAIKDGLLDRNPVRGVKFLPEASTTRFLSDDELARLRGMMSPDHWQLVVFAIETGLRREEQFLLKWNQVDLENGVLTLPLPKGGRTRHIPLSEGAKTILRALPSILESGWVFPSPTTQGLPLDSRNFMRRVYEPALRKAGIKGVCWHTLRHTAASRRIMAGVDLVSVKLFLGHRNIETTMRYSHLSPDHLRQAVNKGSLSDQLRTATSNPAPAALLPNLNGEMDRIESEDLNRDQNRDQEEEEKTEDSEAIDFMVRPAGLEPATHSLEGCCSIHLSYGRASVKRAS